MNAADYLIVGVLLASMLLGTLRGFVREAVGLLAWLGGTRLATVVVLHANHEREVDPAVAAAAARLRQAGCTLLNQSVLLAGVNDSVAALADLSRALFAAGALPYYLHLLDRVAGAAHFDVPEDRARRLLRELRAELPGYLTLAHLIQVAHPDDLLQRAVELRKELFEADALKIAEEIKPFAVIEGNPAAGVPITLARELVQRGILCMCTTSASSAFYTELPPLLFSSPRSARAWPSESSPDSRLFWIGSGRRSRRSALVTATRLLPTRLPISSCVQP